MLHLHYWKKNDGEGSDREGEREREHEEERERGKETKNQNQKWNEKGTSLEAFLVSARQSACSKTAKSQVYSPHSKGYFQEDPESWSSLERTVQGLWRIMTHSTQSSQAYVLSSWTLSDLEKTIYTKCPTE